MTRDEILWEKVCLPAYIQMYKEASPSADFKAMIKSGEAKEQGFFSKYYLPYERQNEIVAEHIKKTKKPRLTKRDKEKITTEMSIGCSPRGCLLPYTPKQEETIKKLWKEYRKAEDKYFDAMDKINEKLAKRTGIENLELFMIDGAIVGIGDQFTEPHLKHKLLNEEELEGE